MVKEIVRSLKNRFVEEDIDLTIEQYFILNILDNEEGLILQELAEIVDRDKSAVLRHIDGLEQHHFVTRVQDDADKRRKLLLITKPGIKALEKARAVDQKLDKEINGEVENIETKEFEDALANMYQFLIDQ